MMNDGKGSSSRKGIAATIVAICVLTFSPTSAQAAWLDVVAIFGWMNLEDDDGRTSVTQSFPVRGFLSKTASNFVDFVECVDDEVWSRIRIRVTNVRDDGSVDLSVRVQLYEGTSCSTSDLEGTRMTEVEGLSVWPDQNSVRTIRGSIENGEFRSDDRVMYRLTLTNVRVEVPPFSR